ncbi:MAG TPA: dienelactone hydrolase family protein [Chloroflexota bacterium]|nr:dienelactone hydrolase family protein [Chloroflexota bacterium]
MDETQAYLAHEFLDDYRAERMDRRSMLRRITLLLGGAVTASAWLQMQGVSVSVAEAAESYNYRIPPVPPTVATIDENDPSIATAGAVQFSARDGATLFGYVAKPAGLSPVPAIIIIHDNRGLSDHQRDVARRFAKQGFIALAIDLVSREGGSGSMPDGAAVSAALSRAGTARHVGDLTAAIDYLISQPDVVNTGSGVIGYCFGGSLTWRMAVGDERVAAAVPYYGSAPPLENVPAMRAATFGVYASDDDRVNQSSVPLEEALRVNGKTYAMKRYPGTRHGFFNDTGSVYEPEAASDAWSDTVAWFRQYLPTA